MHILHLFSDFPVSLKFQADLGSLSDIFNQKKKSNDRHSEYADTIKEQMIINIGVSKHYSTMWRNGLFVKSAIILQQAVTVHHYPWP